MAVNIRMCLCSLRTMCPLLIKLFSDYIFFIVDALLNYCNTWYLTELILDVNNTFKTKHEIPCYGLGCCCF